MTPARGERWGAARRDCAPHRGNVLLLLAWTAWALGLPSFCLVVTGWAALPLAWAVDWLAQRDLEPIMSWVSWHRQKDTMN
jgi:hypothetical protein